MAFTKDEIKKKFVERPKKMLAAEKYMEKLLRNVHGVGYKEYLAKINGYENDVQFQAREKYSISNKPEVANILRPTEKIWTAKGGSNNIIVQSAREENIEKLNTKLLDVFGGYSLHEYMRYKFFDKFIVDPNGVHFFPIKNVSKEEDTEELDMVIEYKSSFQIWDYELEGLKVNWVIFFEPTPEEDTGTTYKIWVVEADRIQTYYVTLPDEKKVPKGQPIKADLIKLTSIDDVENSLEFVPALVNSPLENYDGTMRISALDCQIELLDRLLISTSVLSINEFFYNYIRGWEYSGECKACNGLGTIKSKDRERRDIVTTCPSCNGSTYANRDVTDMVKIRPPKNREDPVVDAPFGYIFVPTDAWVNQDKSIGQRRNFIFYSQWGTVYETGKQSNTATGRFLDAQPVFDRLDWYSSILERVHSYAVDMYGKFYYKDTYNAAEVRYGRRFLIETPDVIWERYLNSRKQGANQSALDRLYMYYVSTEYRESTNQYQIAVKKAKKEPFLHNTILDIMNSPTISDEDKLRKLYFGDWARSLEDEDWLLFDAEKLEKSFSEYLSNKSLIKIEKQDEQDR